MTNASDSSRDTLRQVLFALFAVLNPLASNLPQLTGTGRTIGDQSDSIETWLVPWPPAFAIWGPIFLGLLGYAVIQFLPRNRTRAVYREASWYVLGAMALSGVWAIIASYAPVEMSRWLTALVFVVLVVLACQGMVALSRRYGDLSNVERWLVYGSASLFAGWGSIAVFINWEQVFIGVLDTGLDQRIIGIVLVVLCLAWVGWNLFRSGGSLVYAFPVVWGLAFLAYGRFVVGPIVPVIGGAALVALAVVAFMAMRARR